MAEAVLGTARVGRWEARGRGPDSDGADPTPPLPVHRETAGGRGDNPTPAEPSLPGLPAPEFLGGHLPFRHTHSHIGDSLSRLSMDPMTVTWRLRPGTRLGLRLQGEALAVQLGRFGGRGRGKGRPAFFPRCSLILRGPHSTKGAVVRRTAGLASNQANEFSGSEAGARCQPRYSISKPWRCCSLLLGAGPDKIRRSGFPFRHSHRCCLSPWAPPGRLGPGGTYSPQLFFPSLLPGSEELLPG